MMSDDPIKADVNWHLQDVPIYIGLHVVAYADLDVVLRFDAECGGTHLEAVTVPIWGTEVNCEIASGEAEVFAASVWHAAQVEVQNSKRLHHDAAEAIFEVQQGVRDVASEQNFDFHGTA